MSYVPMLSVMEHPDRNAKMNIPWAEIRVGHGYRCKFTMSLRDVAVAIADRRHWHQNELYAIEMLGTRNLVIVKTQE